ncbi:hypothetical protein L7F22_039797 [Adiantum nelumboides]|nr:hypothetical protein [Adiantum nelumboides]
MPPAQTLLPEGTAAFLQAVPLSSLLAQSLPRAGEAAYYYSCHAADADGDATIMETFLENRAPVDLALAQLTWDLPLSGATTPHAMPLLACHALAAPNSTVGEAASWLPLISEEPTMPPTHSALKQACHALSGAFLFMVLRSSLMAKTLPSSHDAADATSSLQPLGVCLTPHADDDANIIKTFFGNFEFGGPRADEDQLAVEDDPTAISAAEDPASQDAVYLVASKDKCVAAEDGDHASKSANETEVVITISTPPTRAVLAPIALDAAVADEVCAACNGAMVSCITPLAMITVSPLVADNTTDPAAEAANRGMSLHACTQPSFADADAAALADGARIFFCDAVRSAPMSYTDEDADAVIEALSITLAKPTKNDLQVEDILAAEENWAAIHAAKDATKIGAKLAAIDTDTSAAGYAAAKNASAYLAANNGVTFITAKASSATPPIKDAAVNALYAAFSDDNTFDDTSTVTVMSLAHILLVGVISSAVGVLKCLMHTPNGCLTSSSSIVFDPGGQQPLPGHGHAHSKLRAQYTNPHQLLPPNSHLTMSEVQFSHLDNLQQAAVCLTAVVLVPITILLGHNASLYNQIYGQYPLSSTLISAPKNIDEDLQTYIHKTMDIESENLKISEDIKTLTQEEEGYQVGIILQEARLQSLALLAENSQQYLVQEQKDILCVEDAVKQTNSKIQNKREDFMSFCRNFQKDVENLTLQRKNVLLEKNTLDEQIAKLNTLLDATEVSKISLLHEKTQSHQQLTIGNQGLSAQLQESAVRNEMIIGEIEGHNKSLRELNASCSQMSLEIEENEDAIRQFKDLVMGLQMRLSNLMGELKLASF